jgi:hypothetical protein
MGVGGAMKTAGAAVAKRVVFHVAMGALQAFVFSMGPKTVVAILLKAYGKGIPTKDLLRYYGMKQENMAQEVYSYFNSDFGFTQQLNRGARIMTEDETPVVGAFNCFNTTIFGNGCYAACNRKDLATVKDYMNEYVFNGRAQSTGVFGRDSYWTPTRVCVDPETYMLRKIENGRPGDPFLVTNKQWLTLRYWLRNVWGNNDRGNPCKGLLIDPRNNFDVYAGYPAFEGADQSFIMRPTAALLIDGMRIRD